MTPRMIYLVGQPGSGKSTLMAALTKGLVRSPWDEHTVPHDVLVDRVTGEVVGAEIGKQRGAFSGTDALASSIIDKAVPWVQTQPYDVLLAEGARLANKRFIQAAADAGYAVMLGLLDHPDADTWRKRRSKALGREQNLSWVKGRLTSSRKLAEAYPSAFVVGGAVIPPEPGKVISLAGHPDELEPILAAFISG
ncbi:terminase small subunit [Mycobacterium phage ChrisnMich]|uniref:Adenylate kinase n=1 Tax=Mycobacterium phage ChrisnMich TaxID=1034130 RepID=G1BL60_9CAUD|nr:terminase small subunit [Mycobacterium phage ChrisnMich]AEJ94575.1 adenylate kinase [Mycobacterium phage ChrisnMich]